MTTPITSSRTALGAINNNLFTPRSTPLKRSHPKDNDVDIDATPVPRKRAAASTSLTPQSQLQRTPGSNSTRRRRQPLRGGDIEIWSDEVTREEHARDDEETEVQQCHGAALRLRLRLKMALYKVQTNQVLTPFPKLRLPQEALAPARASVVQETKVKQEEEEDEDEGIVPPSSPPCHELDDIGEQHEYVNVDEQHGQIEDGQTRMVGGSLWPTPRKSPLKKEAGEYPDG